MTAATTLPLRPELSGLRPYGPPRVDVPVRLNVNENPYPPPPDIANEIAEAVRDAAAGLNRYPDPEARGLRDDLAAYLGHGLTWRQVWPGNGSNEVMLHVFQAFAGSGRAALSFTPTYSMYPEYARSTGTALVAVARRADHSVDVDAALRAIRESQPAVVLLADPNNPTGTGTPIEVVRAVCGAASGVVIVDEAYAEFRAPATPSALSLLDEFPRLAVARTMSKAFGLAGARVGYLAASAEFVEALHLVRLPFHLSAVSQAVARVALAHTSELLGAVDMLREERQRTVVRLRAEGWSVPGSDANFVLVEGLDDPHAVWQRLVDRGVLVRETTIPGALRVSIGTAGEMAAFHAAWGEAARLPASLRVRDRAGAGSRR